MSTVSLALVGSQQCGKTTALSKLCQLLKAFNEELQRDTEDLAVELGRPASRHSWILDALLAERESGGSLEPSLQAFSSGSMSFCGIDTPGASKLAKSAVTVTSLADIAVLVISAAAGEYESALSSGRLKEDALCCFTMGIKNVAVWVTKMDDQTVSFSSSRFEDIKKKVSEILKDVGYKQKDPPFVPISGLLGDNLTSPSSEMAWYTGKSCSEVLEAFGAMNRPAEKPLRIPILKVQAVPNCGTVITGRVEAGALRAGQRLLFSPSGQMSEVQSVRIYGSSGTEGKTGDIVTALLGDDLRKDDVYRGMVASQSSDDPAADAESFSAQVVILDHPGEIRAGYCPQIAIHTALIPCEFEELLAKIDKKTGKEAEVNPPGAKTGDIISVRMRPVAKVCVEQFSAYASLGRFAVREGGRTVAVGVVKEVSKRPIRKARANENQYFG
mmetsp:Transcript_65388/g.156348  ORF Transcript_65388/g.156348 Transcript_65388/m.156348 type:complete len:443 (+) Transcript_65388:53-1381(+)